MLGVFDTKQWDGRDASGVDAYSARWGSIGLRSCDQLKANAELARWAGRVSTCTETQAIPVVEA